MPKRPQPQKKKPSIKKTAKPIAKEQLTTAPKVTPAVTPRKAAERPRGLARVNYRLWRISRSEYHVRRPKLSSVWFLTKQAALVLWRNKKLFLGIILFYALLNLILVQGFASSSDVTSFHSALEKTIHGNIGGVGPGIAIFAILAGSSSSGTTGATGAYQVMLLLIVSLALIWSLRQVIGSDSKIRIRDAYYKGIYPLVPFILVLLVIGLELLPFLIGGALYGIVIGNGIAASIIEKILWTLFFGGAALISLFLISSSIFALYIVTLPEMTPLKALRSARELVRYRRWVLLVKILYLPLMLGIVMGLILAPIVILVTSLTQWVFFALSMLALAAVHSYMYTLYRELLNE
jgi:hypothetical protein